MILNGRTMKRKTLAPFVAGMTLLAGCSDSYDDSSLQERLDALEERVSVLSSRLESMNENVSALAGLAGAYAEGLTVVSVEQVLDEEGNLTDWKVTFSNSSSILIHNGVDGKDGKDGTDGENGSDGTPGHSPAVGVSLVDGTYYWTVDGVLLRDSDGNLIPASPDPSEALAHDGQTPVISIVDGYWVVTVGSSSQTLGPVTDSEAVIVDGVFSSVNVSGTSVEFVLSSGAAVTMPLAVPFSITLSVLDTLVLGWTVSGTSSVVSVDVITDGKWKVAVSSEDNTHGRIVLTAPSPANDAGFLVLASDGSASASGSFHVKDGAIAL